MVYTICNSIFVGQFVGYSIFMVFHSGIIFEHFVFLLVDLPFGHQVINGWFSIAALMTPEGNRVTIPKWPSFKWANLLNKFGWLIPMTFTFWLITVQFGEPFRHLYMWLNGREPLNLGEFYRFSWHVIHQNEEFMNIFWGFIHWQKEKWPVHWQIFGFFHPGRWRPWPRCFRGILLASALQIGRRRGVAGRRKKWTKLEGNVSSSKSHAILVMVHQKKDIFRTSFGDPCLRSIHIEV